MSCAPRGAGFLIKAWICGSSAKQGCSRCSTPKDWDRRCGIDGAPSHSSCGILAGGRDNWGCGNQRQIASRPSCCGKGSASSVRRRKCCRWRDQCGPAGGGRDSWKCRPGVPDGLADPGRGTAIAGYTSQSVDRAESILPGGAVLEVFRSTRTEVSPNIVGFSYAKNR